MSDARANHPPEKIAGATFEVATALPKPEHAAAWASRTDILAEWLLAEFNRAQLESIPSGQEQVEAREDETREDA